MAFFKSTRTRWLISLGILLLLFPLSPLHAKKKTQLTKEQSQDLTSLVLSGEYAQALGKLQRLPLKKSKGALKNRFRFMQAYLNFQEGEYKKAAQLFEGLNSDYTIMADYIDFYHALALRESGEPVKAIKLLDQLKSRNTSPALKPRLARELALAYCKAGDRGAAIDQLNALIQTESSDIKSYRLRFDRSRCLIDLGYPQEAIVSLRALYLNYPEGDLSKKIRRTLQEVTQGQGLSPSDHVGRGNQLMGNQRPQLAALDFELAIQSYGHRAPATLKKQLAEAYFKSRQYPKAAQAYEDLVQQHPELLDEKTRLRLAQAYSRSDQFDKAIDAYETMMATGGGGSQASLEYKIAFLHMDKGDYKQANQLFENLLLHYPKHSRKARILWYLAWNHYQLKNYDQALAYFSQLEAKFPKAYAKRVPYWRARILEKQGNQKAANQVYQAIAERDPFSYYGFLSLKRLENNFDPLQPPQGAWTRDLPRLNIPAPFSLNNLAPGGKQSVQRLKELLLVGLWTDFLAELGAVTRMEGVDSELRPLQAELTHNPSTSATDSGIWSGRYPPAYATLVSLFSKTRNFPMALTWAIMREESRFRPKVVSPAQAIGLMQIIPPTGVEIAEDLEREGFIPEHLYQPVTNIEYGVHYLNKNLKRFQGKFPQTIASYNAGPDAVTRWITARKNRDWDEFVEEIPYKETNLYVKKVLKSYYLYRLLYPGS